MQRADCTTNCIRTFIENFLPRRASWIRPNWFRTWLEKSTFAKLTEDHVQALPNFSTAVTIIYEKNIKYTKTGCLRFKITE